MSLGVCGNARFVPLLLVVEATMSEIRIGQTVADWQPIETAPKGTWGSVMYTNDPRYVEPPTLLLLLEDGKQCCGYADYFYVSEDSYWCEAVSGELVVPTHWAFQPPPPEVR